MPTTTNNTTHILEIVTTRKWYIHKMYNHVNVIIRFDLIYMIFPCIEIMEKFLTKELRE